MAIPMATSTSISCPGEEELVNLLAQGLEELRAQEIRAHADACDECSGLLAALIHDREARLTPSDSPGPPTLSEGQELVAHPFHTGTDPRGTLTHFRIQRLLGRGGMGEVYLATDTALGRSVAIKFLGPKIANDPRTRARFAREALITARLQHPSIVSLYQAGSSPTGDPFYVMRLVPGTGLDEAIKKAPGVTQRLALLPHLLATADALAYAHAQGVVHRDLKPANVLTGEFGETVVVDWGLAKDLQGANPEDADDVRAVGAPSLDVETRVGAVIGTPAYMSPEQAAGQPADQRSDVYAIGAMLYELLAQRPPYQRGSGEATVEGVRAGPPVPRW
jgi:serine/threonine protein kinase